MEVTFDEECFVKGIRDVMLDGFVGSTLQKYMLPMLRNCYKTHNFSNGNNESNCKNRNLNSRLHLTNSGFH